MLVSKGLKTVKWEDMEVRLTHMSAGSQEHEAKESNLRLHVDRKLCLNCLTDGRAQRWGGAAGDLLSEMFIAGFVLWRDSPGPAVLTSPPGRESVVPQCA